jgi:hypothetical protein
LNDFYDWKKHSITEAVMSAVQERINYLTEELVERAATASPTELAQMAGSIKAYRDLVNISFEDLTQETAE